jgi:hypothetical protein
VEAHFLYDLDVLGTLINNSQKGAMTLSIMGGGPGGRLGMAMKADLALT